MLGDQEASVVDWSTIDFSKHQPRPLARSHKGSLRLCAKLVAPLALAVLYFGVVYLVGVDNSQVMATTAKLSFTIEGRKVCVGFPESLACCSSCHTCQGTALAVSFWFGGV